MRRFPNLSCFIGHNITHRVSPWLLSSEKLWLHSAGGEAIASLHRPAKSGGLSFLCPSQRSRECSSFPVAFPPVLREAQYANSDTNLSLSDQNWEIYLWIQGHHGFHSNGC